MFHRHLWKERERLTSPRLQITNVEKFQMSERMAERLLMGVTTIVLRCEHCGDLKSVEILGSSYAGATLKATS